MKADKKNKDNFLRAVTDAIHKETRLLELDKQLRELERLSSRSSLPAQAKMREQAHKIAENYFSELVEGYKKSRRPKAIW